MSEGGYVVALEKLLFHRCSVARLHVFPCPISIFRAGFTRANEWLRKRGGATWQCEKT